MCQVPGPQWWIGETRLLISWNSPSRGSSTEQDNYEKLGLAPDVIAWWALEPTEGLGETYLSKEKVELLAR